jgi:hypothetical protein
MALVYVERIREVRGGDEISEKTQSHVIKDDEQQRVRVLQQYSSTGSATPINSARW